MSASLESRIEVAFAVDRAYVMPLAASVRSLLDNKLESDRVRVSVIGLDLTEADRRRLHDSWSLGDGDEVRFVEHRAGVIEHLPVRRRGSWSTANYLPLLAPQYLADLERVVFLDADTLTLGSLAPLWTIDLRGAGIAAAVDPWTPRLGARDGVQVLAAPADARAAYFNAGVMVLDLVYWRQHNVAEQALTYLEQHGDVVESMEQEALNWFFRGRFCHLDQRFNVMNFWEHPQKLERRPDMLDTAVIRHFESLSKPWKTLEPLTRTQASFFDYLDRTDWTGWRPPHLWRDAGVRTDPEQPRRR